MSKNLITWLSKQSSEDQVKIVDDIFGGNAYQRLIDHLEVEKKLEMALWRKGTTQQAAAEIAARRMRSLSEATKLRRLPDGTKRKAIQGKYFLLIKKLRKEGYSWLLMPEQTRSYLPQDDYEQELTSYQTNRALKRFILR